MRSFVATSMPLLRDFIPRANHPQVAPHPLQQQQTRPASSKAHPPSATASATPDAQVPTEDEPKTVLNSQSEPEVAKEQYRNTTKEFFDKLEEAERYDQRLAKAVRKEGEKKPWTDLFKPTDQIHVMGLNIQGRYVAHTLAGAETIPPPIFMINRWNLLMRWNEAGRCLKLHREKQVIVRDRIRAQFTPPICGPHPRKEKDTHISNLVVTVPAGHTVEALGQISHRLDHNSTIVLIQEGLGVAESICKAYFPIESQRPVFILGHLTTRLGLGDQTFEFGEVRPGRLFLTVYTPHSDNIGPLAPIVIKKHPPTLWQRRGAHLLKLLTSIPELNATGHRTDEFLQMKLPAVAFRAVADPLATILDSTYDKIPENPNARELMDRMLSEVADVVSHLPELKGLEQFRVANALPFMRSEVFHRLKRKGTADVPMRRLTSMGLDTDIGYVTGYFVIRGKMLGVPVKALESLWSAVKAKQQVLAERRKRYVPFEVPFQPTLVPHTPEPWTNYPDRVWPEPLKNLLNKIRTYVTYRYKLPHQKLPSRRDLTPSNPAITVLHHRNNLNCLQQPKTSYIVVRPHTRTLYSTINPVANLPRIQLNHQKWTTPSSTRSERPVSNSSRRKAAAAVVVPRPAAVPLALVDRVVREIIGNKKPKPAKPCSTRSSCPKPPTGWAASGSSRRSARPTSRTG